MIAVHTTMRPIGYHSIAAGSELAEGRARSARYPIHQPGRPMPMKNANAIQPPNTIARPAVANRRAARPARWVQPIAAIMIGSWAKLASAKDSAVPDEI